MKAIIIGATSGIGRGVADLMVKEGWTVGITGRRLELLESFRREHPGADVHISAFDITADDSSERMLELIERIDGTDLIFLVSGTGRQNRDLDPEIELNTVTVNCLGFVKMIDAAFTYFKSRDLRKNEGQPVRGHIAVISSIAGTKGMGTAPAYSASKRMQNTYVDALAQLARMQGIPVDFTDIRPGFVRTAILSAEKKYPMLMTVDHVALLIFKAIKAHRRRVVIDWRFALLTFFWNLVPQPLWERLKGIKS